MKMTPYMTASACLDSHEGEAVKLQHFIIDHNDKGAGSAHVMIGQALTIWTRDPERLRELAAELIDAAADLDAHEKSYLEKAS